MLVSKARFICFLQKYKDAYEEQRRFHDALRPFFDFPVCTYQDDLFNSYESMLVAISECEDEDGIFSWWVENHPNDDKCITVKDIYTGDEKLSIVWTSSEYDKKEAWMINFNVIGMGYGYFTDLKYEKKDTWCFLDTSS